MSVFASAVVIMGLVAVLAMNVWAFLLWRLWNIPSLDYALVGRWLLTMPSGVFVHHSIRSAPSRSGERLAGWAFHIVTGVVFAAVFAWWTGWNVAAPPSFVQALGFGLATVVFPFFVMQPALGMGLVASRTPEPWHARLKSIATHAVFGLGLSCGGWVAKQVVG